MVWDTNRYPWSFLQYFDSNVTMKKNCSLGSGPSRWKLIFLHSALPLMLGCIPLTGGTLYAQEPILYPWVDSILPIDLSEVILISSRIKNLEHHAQPNP